MISSRPRDGPGQRHGGGSIFVCPDDAGRISRAATETAWAMLHELRRAMVRPGRDRLRGVVEVDETYWGGEEEGAVGRLTEEKALIMVAAEEDGKGIGRIRLRQVVDLTRATLHGFIAQSIDLGSTVRTDGLNAYLEMKGYVHDRQAQRRQPEGEHLLPRVHRVVSLLKRWLLGTHQGAIGHEYLDYYLERFTFRFNRRKITESGQAVLPFGPTSRASGAGPIRFIAQTTIPSGRWSQVNTPKGGSPIFADTKKGTAPGRLVQRPTRTLPTCPVLSRLLSPSRSMRKTTLDGGRCSSVFSPPYS